MKQWQCSMCGFIYDEKLGRPEDGLGPNTQWDDVPATWTCPDCSAAKADFTPVES